MIIKLHIDRLILDGLPLEGAQVPLLQAAMEKELALLIAANGHARDLRSGGTALGGRTSDIQLGSETLPARLGKQIAQSVYRRIGEAR